MCGIVGVRESWLGDSAGARLQTALEALAWRGPDGLRRERAGDWHLGVARLAITDPGAPQPLRCEATGRVVVFNGADTSAARDWGRFATARTRNDAELVLLRLAADGPAAMAPTSGHHAAAVVDPRDDVLWLLRDREGEKPLHVLVRGGRVVAFASTTAALRALGGEVSLGDQELTRLLAFGLLPRPRCEDPDLELRSGLHGVWEDRPGAGLRPLGGAPAFGDHGELRGRVGRAAGRCATAQVPVGLALSGGLDSSCLAVALAAQGMRPPAYQFRAQGDPERERVSARAVCEATGIELRVVDGGAEVVEVLPALTAAVGLPLGDPSVCAVHALALAAARDGVRVLLSGEGADELFLGYRRHRAARFLPRRGIPLPLSLGLRTGYAARMLRALTSDAPYAALLRVAPPKFLDEVLAPGLPPPVLPEPEGSSLPRGQLETARALDRQVYLRHDLLPKLDAATMAAGVEGRCPYLDPEVTGSPEANAPARAVLGKRALRAAFHRELPATARQLRKRGFGLPLDAWLRQDGLLPDLLADARTRQRPHLQAGGLARMLDLHRSGRARLGHPLYLVGALELWLRWREETPCA